MAMPGFDISLIGDKRLSKKFGKLERNLQLKVLRKAMREVMRPVLASAKSRAPVESGRLTVKMSIKNLKPRLALRDEW